MRGPRHSTSLILLLAALSAHAQTPAPAPIPAPKPGDVVAVEDVFVLLAEKHGAIILKPKPIPGTVTIREELPADPEKAVAWLNDLLLPLDYQARRSRPEKNAAFKKPILKLMTLKDARDAALAEGPVSSGTDPKAIDTRERDRLITHVVPITDSTLINAARRAASDDAEVDILTAGSERVGYQLIVTGPAVKVRRAVEAIVAVDGPIGPTIIRSMVLKNLDSQTSANVVANSYPAVKAAADRNSNVVVLSGPQEVVFAALGMLQRLDAVQPPPAPPLKVEVPEKSFAPRLLPETQPATKPGS